MTELTRRELFNVAGKAAALGLGAGVLSTLGVPGTALAECARGVRLTTHRLETGRRPDAPVRVVHLTDLHAGHTTDWSLIRGAVELAQRARPDLVVLTGDYLTASVEPLDELMEALTSLPRPALAVLGNHDHHMGSSLVKRRFQHQDIEVLGNSNTSVDLGGTLGTLRVVGVDDAHTANHDVRAAFKGLSAGERAGSLVMTHRASIAEEIAAAGGRILLSGHTHGGQVSVPILSRAVTRAMGYSFIAGWYEVGPARLFVNAGIGTANFPLRIGFAARPEVAVVTIT